MLEKILHNLHLFVENNFFFIIIIRRSDLSRWICLPQTANWPQETTQGVKIKTVVIFFPNCFLLSLSQSWAIAFQSPEKEETYLSSPALLLFPRCEASLEHAGLY